MKHASNKESKEENKRYRPDATSTSNSPRWLFFARNGLETPLVTACAHRLEIIIIPSCTNPILVISRWGLNKKEYDYKLALTCILGTKAVSFSVNTKNEMSSSNRRSRSMLCFTPINSQRNHFHNMWPEDVDLRKMLIVDQTNGSLLHCHRMVVDNLWNQPSFSGAI